MSRGSFCSESGKRRKAKKKESEEDGKDVPGAGTGASSLTRPFQEIPLGLRRGITICKGDSSRARETFSQTGRRKANLILKLPERSV